MGVKRCHYHADGAVSLLADDDFSLSLLGILVALVVHLVTIDEDDDVRILLDGARFTQVRQLRTLVGPFLDLSVELGQGNDRDIELLGQGLERARDLGNFLFPGASDLPDPFISCR